eukprot:TRINITY_DN3059_c0_g1_i1.p2 TRINITY_DN3059_c0_g1~~TRINITY_DN3059_c0_g1_i1.p2  ORF type:complete len:392 (+),score=145.10 TRINITY_DN3059_c0_g1_i1:48-1223(+)
MAFLAELQSKQASGVALKKVATKDGSAPLQAGFMTKAAVDEYAGYITRFDAERWIPLLKGHTPETQFVEVTLEEGRALHALCEALDSWKSRVGSAAWAAAAAPCDEAGVDVKGALAGLVAKVASAMVGVPSGANGRVFARMSCRSAKDVVTARLTAEYRQRLQSLKDCLGAAPDAAAEVSTLLDASTALLCQSDAAAILETFALSERVLGDLGRALNYPEKWCQHVVLREWFPVHVGLEFRCFVHGNVLTAVSQYNYFVYFEEVAANKDTIFARIKQYWAAECEERLRRLESYIIDFAFYPDEGVMPEVVTPSHPSASPLPAGAAFNEKYPNLTVIEVNPFYDTTGAALFSWEADREAIRTGPAELRVVEEPHAKRPEVDPEYLSVLGWAK